MRNGLVRRRSKFSLLIRLGILGVWGALAAASPGQARFVVSEVMADPSALADAQGEFLELVNAQDVPFAADTVRVVVDGDTLAAPRVQVEGWGHVLLCRDSAAMAAAGAACHRALPGLSLPNGRAIAIAAPGSGTVTVPGARAGVSWENTLAEEKGFAEFARSGRVFLGGDSATPGFRNSRSRRAAERDLALTEARLEEGGTLEARVEDRGARRLGGGLSVRADLDWDGTAETPVDSVGVPPGGGNVKVTLGPDHLGWIRVDLHGDEDPAGNAAGLFREAGKTLEITEVCPDPGEGPEWAELRNATGEGGGFPRSLSLERVEWDGRALGAGAGRLGPGDYLILAEDSAAFRKAMGPLKAKVVEPASWPGLRNSGDTCRLSVDGHPVDSLAYGARAAAEAPCLARSRGLPGGTAAAVPVASPSPGYPAPRAPDRLAWRLSSRVLAPGSALEAEVEAPPGRDYVIKAFDLEGNSLAVVGRGGQGLRTHRWDGTGPGGTRLPPGPYVLALLVAGESARRQVVVVAGSP